MKKYIFLLIVLLTQTTYSQITFNGCHSLFENQDFVFTNTGTDTAGHNIYETTPINGDQPCPIGACEFRIFWNTANSRWEFIADTGDGDFVNPNVIFYNTSNALPNPPNLTYGTWISNQTNDCGDLTTSNCTFTGTLQQLCNTPAPVATNPQVYPGTSIIASLTATGTNLQWYAAATGGTALPTTSTLVDGTTYYVSQTLSSCESTRTLVSVHKISEASQTLCNPATVANLVSTPSSGATASWFTTASGGTALANTVNLTTGTYYLEQTTPESIVALGSGFNFPYGIAIQSDGKIVVADSGNNVIKRMNTDGSNIETLGSGFFSPYGAAIQLDGKIVVADSGTNVIKRMNADGTSIETLGTGFYSPRGVAIQSDGKIVVADFGDSSVKRMNADGTGVVILRSGFSSPRGIAVQSDGKIVVANEGGANPIQRMNADGTGLASLGSGFNFTTGIAIQSDGKIVVADFGNNAIKRMKTDGTDIVTLGSGFTNPYGVAIQSDGKIVVADYGNSAIKRITEASISNRVAVNVIVNTTPAPTGTAMQSFCSAATPTIASLAATGTAIQWYAAASGGVALATTTALVNGTHYFASQTLSGCESTSRLDVTATVNSTPAAPTGSTSQTFCTGETVGLLLATGTGIVWYDAATAGNIVAGTSALVSGTTYYASQTVNGCESTTKLTVTATTGPCLGTDSFDNDSFIFYPNPTSNTINIQYSKTIDSVSVIDLLGQLVFENKTNNTNVQIDLSQLPTATYFVKVKADGKEKIVKVIKK